MNIYLGWILICSLTYVLIYIRIRRQNYENYVLQKKIDPYLNSILNLEWDVSIDEKKKIDISINDIDGYNMIINDGKWHYKLTPDFLEVTYGSITKVLYTNHIARYLYEEILLKVINKYEKEDSDRLEEICKKEIEFQNKLNEHLGI